MGEEDNKKVDLSKYNPVKLSNEELIEDWKVAIHMRCRSDLPYPSHEIYGYTCKIFEEIQTRISNDKLEHEFKPDKMTEPAKIIYDIVLNEMKLKEMLSRDEIPDISNETEETEPTNIGRPREVTVEQIEEIKKLSKETDLSRNEIAKRLNLSTNTIYRYQKESKCL